MPRIKALRINYMQTDAKKMFRIKLVENDLLQKDLAEVIGMSPAAFSKRFKKFDFNYEQLAKMIAKLNFSDEEIIKFMKM